LELNLGGGLLLFDRWYPSAEFIAFLYDSGFHFVMRVRRKFNLEADAIKTQGWIRLKHNGKEYPVRVLKVMLPTGEIETLFTSLHQKQLPIRKAGELYFQRWGVETSYDFIKSTLELENFSSKTKVSVLQDFYATMYLANIISFANRLLRKPEKPEPSYYDRIKTVGEQKWETNTRSQES
jgi:IS4 transposase